jgi:hypothetical protein
VRRATETSRDDDGRFACHDEILSSEDSVDVTKERRRVSVDAGIVDSCRGHEIDRSERIARFFGVPARWSRNSPA